MLRFGLNWFLSGALGPELFGIYAWAASWGSTLSSFSPLGLDTGIVLFYARYRKSGEKDKAKGALLFGLGTSILMGLVSAVALVLLAPQLADTPNRVLALRWTALLLLPWTPLLYLTGALRAAKDMRRSVLASQVALPLVLVLGSVIGVLMGAGFDGALAALVVATTLATAMATVSCARHFGGLLRDGQVTPTWEPQTLLAFSIPQGLTAAAFRLNSYMDLLMLGYLASDTEVGVYKIAAGLAAFGTLPSNAVASMFNPFIAELVYVGEIEKLNGLLKTVTRWLIVAAAPVYLVLLVLPDTILGIYDPIYATAMLPLVLLVAGQAIQTACAPTMRLIPMSGHAVLNLVNGLVALALNVGLNAVLIPRYGAVGAAWATGLTLALWSTWRVVEVRWLLRCFPFDWRSGAILAVCTLVGLLARTAGHGAPPRTQVALLVVGLAALLGVVLAVSRTPDDRALAARLRNKLGRFRRPRTPGTP